MTGRARPSHDTFVSFLWMAAYPPVALAAVPASVRSLVRDRPSSNRAARGPSPVRPKGQRRPPPAPWALAFAVSAGLLLAAAVASGVLIRVNPTVLRPGGFRQRMT